MDRIIAATASSSLFITLCRMTVLRSADCPLCGTCPFRHRSQPFDHVTGGVYHLVTSVVYRRVAGEVCHRITGGAYQRVTGSVYLPLNASAAGNKILHKFHAKTWVQFQKG